MIDEKVKVSKTSQNGAENENGVPRHYEFWKDRYNALNISIEEHINSLHDEAHSFKCLFKCLKSFAHCQFEFLFDGFFDHEKFELVPSREFHPDYSLRVTLEQLAIDIETLRRAADQRLSGSKELQNTLAKADGLAWRALKPVVGPGKLITNENTTVLTYFEKNVSVRIIPYAQVALVGIPLTARSVVRDYLGIAHEIGHFVYRQGRLAGGRRIPQTLGRQLLEQHFPKWIRKWKEEVFADIYSCLVAGPVMAVSSQDLTLHSSLTPLTKEDAQGEYHIFGEFTQDDSEHPIPVLRPYIFTKVLEQMDLGNLSEALVKRWQHFPQVAEVEELELHYSNNRDPIPVEGTEEEPGARNWLEMVVKLVLDHLAVDDLWSDRWADYSQRSDSISKDEIGPLPESKVQALYDSFEKNLDHLVSSAGSPPPFPDQCPPDDMWENWLIREGYFPGFPLEMQPPGKDVTEIWPGVASKTQYLEQEPRYTWIHVLNANGWATRLDHHEGG